jgi:hypothetical protein
MTKDETGNPIGRPKKVKKVKGKSNPVGRPKGEAGIMKDYRERMLNSPKSRKVLDSIFNAALDDDHKNQAAAWKIVMDRIVPVSGFDKLAGQSGRSAITVNITGVGEVEVGQSDPLEGEYVPVEVSDV